jgi:hypothetical protein
MYAWIMPRQPKAWRDFSCLRCGVLSQTKYDQQKFCTRDCAYKYIRETYQYKEIAPISWTCECGEVFYRTHWRDRRRYCDKCRLKYKRARYRIKTVKRQGAQFGMRISVDQIAERDNYVCHLCDDFVDMALPRTLGLGATVDHLLPISKGGLDIMENVKLAHWSCNRRKGNRVDA